MTNEAMDHGKAEQTTFCRRHRAVKDRPNRRLTMHQPQPNSREPIPNLLLVNPTKTGNDILHRQHVWLAHSPVTKFHSHTKVGRYQQRDHPEARSWLIVGGGHKQAIDYAKTRPCCLSISIFVVVIDTVHLDCN